MPEPPGNPPRVSSSTLPLLPHTGSPGAGRPTTILPRLDGDPLARTLAISARAPRDVVVSIPRCTYAALRTGRQLLASCTSCCRSPPRRATARRESPRCHGPSDRTQQLRLSVPESPYVASCRRALAVSSRSICTSSPARAAISPRTMTQPLSSHRASQRPPVGAFARNARAVPSAVAGVFILVGPRSRRLGRRPGASGAKKTRDSIRAARAAGCTVIGLMPRSSQSSKLSSPAHQRAAPAAKGLRVDAARRRN